ncbi:MAG: hypothetical protein IT270_14875 [Saprospiraceae bacterium]|nr:hypothetical protein [Saprospiraceae bacterium]
MQIKNNTPPPHLILKFVLCVCVTVIFLFSFCLFPKWNQSHTEATIGWDVSGYYAYLPAAFIYKDLKKAAFLDPMLEQYHFTPSKSQGFHNWTGNYIMKYSMGQALQFLPWFAVANVVAAPLGYPADGYSLPYQVAIAWGSLLVAILGLWIARRNLLFYFSDKTTALALLLLVFGTNYLNYASVDGAMTHNWLFTCLSLLVFATIRFYQKPGLGWAVTIGGLLGWAALTRPTEIVAVIIPVLWGVGNVADLKQRFLFVKKHFTHYAAAAVVCAAVGFLQLVYWKYVGKEWIIYSYEDQGFDWRTPHFMDVLFSYRCGWLVYSPMMFFGVAGLYFLYKQHRNVFPAVVLLLAVTLYVVSAWSIWWYGGSLGMRALVQSYALWLFPLAAFSQWVLEKKARFLVFAPVALAFCSYNIWWTAQAHKPDGVFVSEQMNKAYFWKVLSKNKSEREWLMLLDSPEALSGKDFSKASIVFKNNFETDSLGITSENPIEGKQSLLLTGQQQFSPNYFLPLNGKTSGALRTTLTFACDPKEWDWWRQTQAIVQFKKGGNVLKSNMIRLQRQVDGNEVKTISFDTNLPEEAFEEAVLFFWNAEGDKRIRIDVVEVYWIQ